MAKRKRKKKPAQKPTSSEIAARREKVEKQIGITKRKTRSEVEVFIDSLVGNEISTINPGPKSCGTCMLRYTEKCPTGGMGPVCSLWQPKLKKPSYSPQLDHVPQKSPGKKHPKQRKPKHPSKRENAVKKENVGSDETKPSVRQLSREEQLILAKVAATQAWATALIGYLEPRCQYDSEYLVAALLKRNEESKDESTITLNKFVLDALSGNLQD